MTRRLYAVPVLVVALLVLVACGVSFADAANVAVGPCGPDKGWGMVKIDHSPSGKPTPDVPGVQVGSGDLSEPPGRWAGVDGPAPAPWRFVLAQPRASRAPPLA